MSPDHRLYSLSSNSTVSKTETIIYRFHYNRIAYITTIHLDLCGQFCKTHDRNEWQSPTIGSIHNTKGRAIIWSGDGSKNRSEGSKQTQPFFSPQINLSSKDHSIILSGLSTRPTGVNGEILSTLLLRAATISSNPILFS